MPIPTNSQIDRLELGQSASLLVLVRNENLDPYEVKVGPDAKDYLSAAWQTTLDAIGDAVDGSHLRIYTPDEVVRGDDPTILYVDQALTDDHDVLGTLLDAVDAPLTRPKDLGGSEIYLYALVGETQGGKVAMIRKVSPVKVARGSKIWANAGEELQVMSESPWQLHPSFDLVVTPEGIFILNSYLFELLLSQSELLVERVDDWANAIDSELPFAEGHLDGLVTRCKGSPRARRRLRSIHQRGHLSRVTTDQIREHLTKMEMTVSDFIDNDRLIVSDENLDGLLKLLNEDFALGGLTGDKFAIEAKTALT